MPDDAGKPRNVAGRAEGERGAIAEAEEEGGKENGNHGLQHIPDQREDRRLFPVNAEHIGEPCVAAPLLSDILAEEKARDDHGAVETSEQICTNDEKDDTDDRDTLGSRGDLGGIQPLLHDLCKHNLTSSDEI